MEYYLYKNDQNIGPLTESEVVAGLRSGRFLTNDLGCRVGESSWMDLNVLFPMATRPVPAPIPQAYSQPASSRQPEQFIQQRPVVVYQPPPSVGGTSDVTRMMYFEANKKSAGIAYLLWFFLGSFGAHRFYLGRPGTAIAQLAIFWGSIVLMMVLIGFLTIWIASIWLFVDLFLIPQIVRDENNKLMAQANSFR